MVTLEDILEKVPYDGLVSATPPKTLWTQNKELENKIQEAERTSVKLLNSPNKQAEPEPTPAPANSLEVSFSSHKAVRVIMCNCYRNYNK